MAGPGTEGDVGADVEASVAGHGGRWIRWQGYVEGHAARGREKVLRHDDAWMT